MLRASTARRLRSRDLLRAVGMEDLGGKRPAELSGGQQQRVAVLRAILTEPDLVLADEPTANLDSTNAEHLLDMMEQLLAIRDSAKQLDPGEEAVATALDDKET